MSYLASLFGAVFLSMFGLVPASASTASEQTVIVRTFNFCLSEEPLVEIAGIFKEGAVNERPQADVGRDVALRFLYYYQQQMCGFEPSLAPVFPLRVLKDEVTEVHSIDLSPAPYTFIIREYILYSETGPGIPVYIGIITPTRDS